jgi:hypothetical protein
MNATIRRGTLVSFDSSTWQALVMLDGSLSEVEMAVGEWVPAALLAADDQVAVLLFEDTNQEDGVILGPFGAASGLLALTGTPANGQVPIGNGSGFTLATITGTANRVTVTNGAGTVTLSAPQDLHTAASPTFGHVETTEAAAPATPASGFLRWFASAAQGWGYFINDAGAEVPAGLAVLNLPVITGHRPGTAVIATVATNTYALGLPNAATPTAVWSLKLPPGWAGRTLAVNFHWAPSTTNGGNCVFFAEAYLIQDAATVSAAATVSGTVVSAGTGTVDRAAIAAITLSLASFAEGDALSFRFGRLGNDAGDTFTGQANVLALELSVVG